MEIAVYLNEAELGGERAFVFESAVLRLAVQFQMPAAGASGRLPVELPVELLETVFDQLNIGGYLIAAEPWAARYLEAGNRLLSVGDVVVVDGHAYAVAASGWDFVPAAELQEAVDRHTCMAVG